jgi:UDP-N-acetylglucosamine--dolichyl-phosphate N-acetylglucosaminephosphotransferase
MLKYYILSGLLAFAITFILTKVIIPRLKYAGITGEDENKEGRPKIAEMGGFAIVGGSVCGILLALFFHTFLGFEFHLVNVLAALITILLISFIGVVDDILNVPQYLKALLPLGAAIPLVAVSAVGSTVMDIPFIGEIDFGIFYIVLLVPLGVAVTSNLTNMFAGYNGMEAGMGSIIFLAIFLIAVSHSHPEMGIISIAMLGALLAFLFYNWYPAKVFPGDVGNLTIGGALASAVIIGNFESAGAILMIPYVIDFFIKLKNGLPHTFSEIKNGKLYPKEGRVMGFSHLAMKAFNGISERNLSVLFIAIEGVFALLLFVMYL